MPRGATPSVPYKLRSLMTVLYQYKISSSKLHYSHGHFQGTSTASKFRNGYSMNQQGLRLISANNSKINKNHDQSHMVMDEREKFQPPTPTPPRPRPCLASWAKWLLGTLLTVLLPFWKQKWQGLLRLEGEAEKVVEEVEYVAEVVEKMANVTEKVSAEVAEKLPGHGRLKNAALFVEHVSNVTAMDAQLTIDLIHKVDVLKKDLKDLETMAEPIIHKIKEEEHGGK